MAVLGLCPAGCGLCSGWPGLLGVMSWLGPACLKLCFGKLCFGRFGWPGKNGYVGALSGWLWAMLLAGRGFLEL